MSTLFQDLRYGLRGLKGSPGYAAVAVITLALGIAANSTVFSWIHSLLLHPVAGARDDGHLLTMESKTPGGEFTNTSYRDFRDYRDRLTTVSGLAGSQTNAFNVGDDEGAQQEWGEYVSGNYFDVLGVRALRGRTWSSAEQGEKTGAYPLAVISYRLWRKQFRGDPGVVGRTIRINRHELTVVGIAPEEFCGSVPGLAMELWIPFTMEPLLNGQGDYLLTDRSERHLWVTARLKPGVTLEQARAEVESVAAELARSEPKTNRGYSAALLPMWKGHFGAQILLQPLKILMTVCFVLLLIVVANVANLQLARTTSRQREFSIRLAVGAGRGRVVRQVLTESLLLAALATTLGVPLAQWMAEALGYLVPPVGAPVKIEARLSADILAFTILVAVATAVLSGLAPALHALRANMNETLKEGGRSGSVGAGLHRLRSLLVVSEVALALVALVGTALFARSFEYARTIPKGFDSHKVVMAQLYVATFCRTVEDRTRFCTRMHDRLEATPGVEGVSYSNDIPLSIGTSPISRIEVEGYAKTEGEDMQVFNSTVSPGYFRVMGIPLLDGRDFTELDDTKTAPVMIVNQTFTRRFFAGQNPLGRHVKRSGRWFTIVGLAKDSKYHRPTEAPTPFIYTAFRQTHGGEFWVAFFARTAGPPEAAIGTVRKVAAEVDANAAVVEAAVLADYTAGATFPQLVAASLLSVLGGICLILAAVGLYSVMAYAVSQRTNEIGIRMSLGARPTDVFAMVVRQGMALTGVGLVVGTAAAAAVMPLLSDMLVGVSATDPRIFAAAAAFLALVAATASYVPARRATRVDPVDALRCE